MVEGVKKLAADWTYDVVSIGYPGPVLGGQPIAEPDRRPLIEVALKPAFVRQGCGRNTAKLAHVNRLVLGRFTSLRGQAGRGDSVPLGFCCQGYWLSGCWSAPWCRLRLAASRMKEKRHG